MAEERSGAERQGRAGDRPRTDLPPKKIPYDDDYFGTGEEEGVVREREAAHERERPADDGRDRQASDQSPHVPGGS